MGPWSPINLPVAQEAETCEPCSCTAIVISIHQLLNNSDIYLGDLDHNRYITCLKSQFVDNSTGRRLPFQITWTSFYEFGYFLGHWFTRISQWLRFEKKGRLLYWLARFKKHLNGGSYMRESEENQLFMTEMGESRKQRFLTVPRLPPCVSDDGLPQPAVIGYVLAQRPFSVDVIVYLLTDRD